MSNILRYKSIVAVCLCFIFVFSFFAFTFQRSEAIATIPLVAVPIIKLLIASGVTFLSVDAMLEVYNRMKGTDYYNTLTGNLLNMLDDLSEDLVSSWLFHDWAMEQPDPPGSGWPEWPELLLGTLCLEIAKSDNLFQDFLSWFLGNKDDLIDEPSVVYYEYEDFEHFNSCLPLGFAFRGPDQPQYFSIGPYFFSIHLNDHGSNTHYGGRMTLYNVENGPVENSIGLVSKNKGVTTENCAGMDLPGCHYVITQAVYSYNYTPTKDNIWIGTQRHLTWKCDIATNGNGSFRVSPNYGSIVETELPIEFPIELPDTIFDEDNFQNSDEEEFPLWLPLPNEIITIDPDEGLDIDFDTEISIEEFTELMTPYVGSTWEDIQQDKPIPSKIPTDVPYPEDPVVPDPVVPPAPAPDEDDLPPDADEGDDPFAGADEGKTIDWDPLKGLGLHKKFPFCIPWDIFNSFRTFNVEGEAPCWKVEFLNDTEFAIDFSIFEPWAVIVRWGILILFNLGLILATRNLIRG